MLSIIYCKTYASVTSSEPTLTGCIDTVLIPSVFSTLISFVLLDDDVELAETSAVNEALAVL